MDGPATESETAERRPALLKIEGLSLGPRAAPFLQGFDLALAAGEVHALVGRNGAGKTTLLRAILGEVEFRGTIRLNFAGSSGHDGRPRARLGRIGYVPQALRFDPVLALTVVEFLALARQRRPLFLGLTAAARTAAGEALAAVDLTGLARRRVSELSGGELRRLLLAHALRPRPDLLLLDEPTEGLDAASLPRVERAIARSREGGSAILLVSHDLALVRRLATRATWLDGTARARGATGEVAAAFLRHELAGAEERA